MRDGAQDDDQQQERPLDLKGEDQAGHAGDSRHEEGCEDPQRPPPEPVDHPHGRQGDERHRQIGE